MNFLKLLVTCILIFVASCKEKTNGSQNRLDSTYQEEIRNLPRVNAQSVISPGKGCDRVVIGQNIKEIIKEVGEPTEVFSRTESKLDSIFHPVRDTSVFLPYYFDFDTAYHFRNENKYGLATVFSKRGRALVLEFTYLVAEKGGPLVNGEVRYFAKAEEVKQAFSQQAIHVIPPDSPLLKSFGIQGDKFEYLFYFEQGIQFDLLNGEMVYFKIHPPVDRKKYDNLIDRARKVNILNLQ